MSFEFDVCKSTDCSVNCTAILQLNNIAFHYVAFGRTEYFVVSKHEWWWWWWCFKETEILVPKSNLWTCLGQWKQRRSDLKWQHVWGRGRFPGRARVSHLQPDRPTSKGQASSSSMSTSASDGFHSEAGQQWTRPSCPQRCVVHTFTGGPRKKRNSEVHHINDNSSPLSVFPLYFAEIITLLVVETDITMTTLTDLTRDLLHYLTWLRLKCLCFLHWQYKWDIA